MKRCYVRSEDGTGEGEEGGVEGLATVGFDVLAVGDQGDFLADHGVVAPGGG